MYFSLRLFKMTFLVPGVPLRVALATLAGVLTIPIAIWRMTLSGQFMAAIYQGSPLGSLLGTLALIALLILLRPAFMLLRDEISLGTAARMKTWLRQRLYEHMIAIGPGHFDQKRTGDTVISLVEGVEQMDTYFGPYVPQLIVAAVAPIVIFAFMAFLDVETAFIFLVFALLTLVAPAMFVRMNRTRSMAHRANQATLASDFLDSMQGLATLKAFGQSKRRGDELAERARTYYRTTMRVLGANLATGSITLFGVTAGAATALILGAIRVGQGELPLSTLLVVLLLGVEVFRPLRDITVLYHASMLGITASHGIFTLLDTQPDIRDPEVAEPVPEPLPATLELRQVTFGYDNGRRPALRDCSFFVREGETVGVVGPSGAGKSTLVNLLLRIADAQAGQILVGGRDVRSLPLDLIRRHIALVAQDTYLFYGSVADNLRLGMPDATQAELEEAARLANADHFISSLPRGYDTRIGERGVRLSGGQRQRIAIARALLKNAPILILDEATSSVDAESEAAIQEALDRLQRGRTTLVIAHRLSSVVNADRIIVLERGQLVESGTHADLVARSDGAYARLMAAQQVVEQEAAATAQPLVEEVPAAHDHASHAHTSADVVPLSHQHTTRGDSPGEPTHASHNGHQHNGHHSQTAAVAAAISGPAAASEGPAEVSGTQVWWRLFRLVRPWRGQTILVLLSGILHAAAEVGVGVMGALLVASVVPAIAGAAPSPPSGVWIGLLIVSIFVVSFFRWEDAWIAHDLAYRLLAELRIRLYRILDPLAPAYLQRRRSGDLVSTTVSDVELMESFYAHTISPAFQAILVPGGVLIALGIFAPALAVVLFPFLVAVALTPLIARKRTEQLGSALRSTAGQVNAHAVDSIQGLRTIVTFTHGQRRAAEIGDKSRELSGLKRSFARWQSVQGSAIEALMGLGTLVVMATGASLVVHGQLGRSTLPLVTILAAASFLPVVAIATVIKDLMQTMASARRFYRIEDEPIPVKDGPGVALPPATQKNLGITFDSVSFSYGPSEPQALQNVSFEIAPGQTVALVGRSGAGKTTIAHLLLRFWDPQHGRIRLGGHDLREFELDDLRALVALVAQDTYLFNISLRENLRLARPDATDQEVLVAARRANVDEFASVLPDGYDTFVGERGVQLSGGQRQRLAIARALLKDAPVLVLDEATSHLDAVNEAQVRQALDELVAGRTTLVIAHRLSTVRDADNILVLDNGTVVEEGKHADLLALDGLYSHLVATQLRTHQAMDGQVWSELQEQPASSFGGHDHGGGHHHH